MLKTKISRAGIRAMAPGKVFYVGYCELQSLLAYTEPEFYNCGLNGWNWDGYRLFTDNGYVIIVTGYSNLTGRAVPNDIVSLFEGEAKEILRGACVGNADRMHALVKDFVGTLLSVTK